MAKKINVNVKTHFPLAKPVVHLWFAVMTIHIRIQSWRTTIQFERTYDL
jgi:hypothetical protein